MNQHIQSITLSIYIVYMQFTKACRIAHYNCIFRVVLVLSSYSITVLSHDCFRLSQYCSTMAAMTLLTIVSYTHLIVMSSSMAFATIITKCEAATHSAV